MPYYIILEFFLEWEDTIFMDTGTLFIISQLIFGAVTTLLAIMLWPKVRDAAWMLIIMGTIVAYTEIVYSVLDEFGIGGGIMAVKFILPSLRMIFFIAGFAVMIRRQSRQN